MSKFIIEQEFWDVFPQAEIAVILAKGITNTEDFVKASRNEINKLLEDGIEKSKNFLGNEEFRLNPVINVWREAFQKFKTKKGVRCSIEALLKRVSTGKGVGNINPLVDIYNAVSLNYALPCGGEDLDTFEGDMRLTKASGGESFVPLGDDEPDDALPGEIIYRDDVGAICRCWNWRDGERTMLTDGTKNAFLIIESVDPTRHESVENAATELANATQKYLGGEVKISYLNINNREIDLD